MRRSGHFPPAGTGGEELRMDYVCRRAWEHLKILLKELNPMAGERQIWASLLRLLAHDPEMSRGRWMDGWMVSARRILMMIYRLKTHVKLIPLLFPSEKNKEARRVHLTSATFLLNCFSTGVSWTKQWHNTVLHFLFGYDKHTMVPLQTGLTFTRAISLFIPGI